MKAALSGKQRKLFSAAAAVIMLALCTVTALAQLEGGTSGEAYSVSYRSQLSDGAKTVYDTIKENIESTLDGESSITIRFAGELSGDEAGGCIQAATSALRLDHPEYFWLSFNSVTFAYSVGRGGKVGEVVMMKDGDSETYYVEPYKSAAEVKKARADMEKEISAVLSSIPAGVTQYETAKLFHDYLVLNNRYNTRVTAGDIDGATPTAWTAVSAFTSKNDGETGPVCEGYSKAFKILCDRVGIPCALIAGTSYSVKNNEVTPGEHMWCAVGLSDEWYGVDVTWDDSSGDDDTDHTFFLCGAETRIKSSGLIQTFAESHEPNMRNYTYVDLNPPTLSSDAFTPGAQDKKTQLELTARGGVYGEDITINVTVVSESIFTPTGEVLLYDGVSGAENLIASSTLVNGAAVITAGGDKRLAAGEHMITVVYTADTTSSACFGTALVTVEKRKLTVTADITVREGEEGVEVFAALSPTGLLEGDEARLCEYETDTRYETKDGKSILVVSVSGLFVDNPNYTVDDGAEFYADLPAQTGGGDEAGARLLKKSLGVMLVLASGALLVSLTVLIITRKR